MSNPQEQEPVELSNGSQPDTPTHFDDLIGKPQVAVTSPAALAVGMMSKDEFHSMFIGGFKIGHAMTGFQSLKIEQDREAKAEACSHALYETIVDVPSLHFMLEPKSKYWGRAFAIGAFTIPTAIGISQEIKARKAAAAAAKAAAPAEVMPQPEQTAEMTGAME